MSDPVLIERGIRAAELRQANDLILDRMELEALYASRRAAIEAQKAYEQRLVRRCLNLIQPLLDIAGFEARIVLYPRENRAGNRTT